MSLRLIAAIAVAVLFGLAQLLPWSGVTASRSDMPTQAAGRIAPSIALAATADNDDAESDSDNSDSGSDNSDSKSSSDNSDSASDNSDSGSDNSDSGSDNSDSKSSSDNSDSGSDNTDSAADSGDNSDGDTGAAAATPPPSVDATLPTTEATGTSNGSDVVIHLGGERVVVSMFPWMPSGVTLVVKRAEPAQFAAVPGTRAGDLLFTIEAKDATGKTLSTLPGEVNLTVRYNEADVKSLTESNLTISRLDTTSNKWSATAKQVRSAESNYIAASVSESGAYAVHTP